MWTNVVIAAFTFLAAAATFVAAWQTRSGVRAQLLETYFRRYSSEDMLRHIMTIDSWWDEHKASAPADFEHHRKGEYGKVRMVDEARRGISHHYVAIYLTHKTHPWFATNRLLRVMVSQDEAQFLAEKIEPLEKAVKPDCSTEAFDYLRLHGLRRQRPEYSNPR